MHAIVLAAADTTEAILAQYSTLGIIATAVLTVLVGIPALIVVAVRRSRRHTAVRPPEWHPPGWYPSPTGTGCLQWWDGTRWTDSFASAPPVFPDTGTPAR